MSSFFVVTTIILPLFNHLSEFQFLYSQTYNHLVTSQALDHLNAGWMAVDFWLVDELVRRQADRYQLPTLYHGNHFLIIRSSEARVEIMPPLLISLWILGKLLTFS